MKLYLGIALLFLCCSAGVSTAQGAPGTVSLTPHTAEYKVKISVLGGRLETQLTASDDGYRGRSLIEATGMSSLVVRGEIVESSEFGMLGDELRPRRFISDDSLTKDKEEELQAVLSGM